MLIKAIKDIPRIEIDGLEREVDKPIISGTEFNVTNEKANELIQKGYALEVHANHLPMVVLNNVIPPDEEEE